MNESIDIAEQARTLARAEFSAWLTDHRRSAWARHLGSSLSAIWSSVERRVDSIVGHTTPAAANRAWLCEAVSAWAPLEVVFPGRLYARDSGVTGELSAHVGEILEREYAHVVAGARGVSRASEILHADAQRLELAIATARALRPLLEPESAAAVRWPEEFIHMSLALSEYMHRQALGLSQVIGDGLVMSYTTQVGRVKRECHNPYTCQTLGQGASA